MDILTALKQAQSIAFAPFVFQATVSALRLGLLKTLHASDRPLPVSAVAERSGVSEYGVKVLLETLLVADVVSHDEDGYRLTKVGEVLLFNPMTEVNLNFTADVCYKGLAHLTDAVVTGTPSGLKELGPWPTIYPALNQLPEPARDSWFKFDHYYSDQVFNRCAGWIDRHLKPARLFDIGGNTGRFAGTCLQRMPYANVTIVDLPEQCQLARNNPDLDAVRDRLQTASVNWLDPDALPQTDTKADVIWMSQFLDCFSPEQAVSILRRAKQLLKPEGKIVILECLWDRQKHEAARLSIVCTSLYFTAIANGNSRFFTHPELLAIVKEAGLVVEETQDGLGISHTLLVCRPE
jgi:ubiquinone/menaquinone biosynthesis C-methylase UbiE